MKRYLWLLAVVPFSLFAQKESKPGFTINGTVKGLAENSKVFLVNLNNTSDTVARTHAKAGKFILTGSFPEPNLYELNFASAKKKVPLFIGNDKITLSGDVEKVNEITVAGSQSQADFAAFQQSFNPYFAELTRLSKISGAAGNQQMADSVSKLFRQQVTVVQGEIDKFIAARKSSYVSPFVLMVVVNLSDDIFLLEKRLNSLAPDVQQGAYGKYLRDMVDNGKIGAVGTDEIDFTQNDTTGKPVNLSSFKGKYVLVDFWASWCGPCRMENPNVVVAYNKFKDKNFTILGVSLDRTRDPWIKAINDDKLTWTQVSDLKFWNNEVAQKYKINQIPQNLLIDPNGKIVGRNLRGQDLATKLCELLGCN